MAGDYDNTVPTVSFRWVAAHSEHFENVEVGQPVSSENTSFQRFVGDVTQAGVGTDDGLYGTKAMSVAVDTPAGTGWYDSGLFDAFGSGSSRRLTVTVHLRVDVLPVGDAAHVAWVSEATTAIVPPVLSLGVSTGGDLVSTGMTLESGSAAIPTGQWVRVVLEAGETPSGHLLCGVDLWTGQNIERPDEQNRAARLSGVISGGAGTLDGGAWAVFGSHGSWSPTAGQITLDAVAVDAWAAPPVDNPLYTQPGMNWWDGVRTRKADLRGWWDGSSVQPAELLGMWTGTDIEPAPE
ncbi:MAG TPA: hypothetical protein VK053_07160 [Jiangellaceae bacterium]|nr:hypothetical protein [Jiangellaceae bacterium]